MLARLAPTSVRPDTGTANPSRNLAGTSYWMAVSKSISAPTEVSHGALSRPAGQTGVSFADAGQNARPASLNVAAEMRSNRSGMNGIRFDGAASGARYSIVAASARIPCSDDGGNPRTPKV